MKILCLLGSRNPEGQTASAAQALLKGVNEQGHETELVILPELSIERCRQCDNDGWGLCRQKGSVLSRMILPHSPLKSGTPMLSFLPRLSTLGI